MFIQQPRSPISLGRRKLIYGVGINDATYQVKYKDPKGKSHLCPYYAVWCGVLQRCFSTEFYQKRPTYRDCTLEESWKVFSNFKKWMEDQDWVGKTIDKDLLVQGNKHYGPNTCLFVSKALNNLTTLNESRRGNLPLGVSETTINKCHYYIASCKFYGKQKRLGYFKDVQEASECYITAKKAYIQELITHETDPKIKAALTNLQF